MKIELIDNKKVIIEANGSKKEIHPFWLRERANGEKFLDKGTQQRLFDPTSLDVEIAIKNARIKDDLLEIDFNDGVNSKLNIEKIAEEFSKEDKVIEGIELHHKKSKNVFYKLFGDKNLINPINPVNPTNAIKRY